MDGFYVILFILEYPHKFTKRLEEITNVLEDARIIFEVEVEDEEAEVTWLHDDMEFTTERSRYGSVNEMVPT